MRRLRNVLLSILLVIALAAVAFLVWANIVMQGEREQALEVWNDPAVEISSDDTSITLTPTSGATGAGLVFIPGAKVDPWAYAYKLSGLVDDGLTVVITKPPLNLAFFDTHTLGDYTSRVSGVSDWYVGGHSLGGVRACMLADSPDVTGVILFGSYCANDLSDSGLTVVSIAASNDLLSTQDKIMDAAPKLPTDTEFAVIDGANHASFGDYGRQPGDGTATASDADVRDEITELVATALEP